MFDFAKDDHFSAKLRVIGVGGCGGNAVNTMINKKLTGVEFWVVNTDVQDINKSLAEEKVQIGERLTMGLGSGGDPEKGRKAAEEDIERIEEIVSGVDMVFITAGMGGGTGTGASPIIAKVAKEKGILTVGVVTKPFPFENKKRMENAERGIKELRKNVDTLLVIPNEKILALKNISLYEALNEKTNEPLAGAVKGITDLIVKPGGINRDFADVRTVMSRGGKALMGIGTGKGENRAIEAAQNAINCPFLEDVSISQAKSILVNFTVDKQNFTNDEFEEAMKVINNAAQDDTEMLLGVVFEENFGDEVKITIIATGIEDDNAKFDMSELELPETEERELPAYLRDGNTEVIKRDDYEIPAFLRRQAD